MIAITNAQHQNERGPHFHGNPGNPRILISGGHTIYNTVEPPSFIWTPPLTGQPTELS